MHVDSKSPKQMGVDEDWFGFFPSIPVMISCVSKDGRPNIIPVMSWSFACRWPPIMTVGICEVDYTPRYFRRASLQMILDTGEFVVNFLDQSLRKVMLQTGGMSANDDSVDKFAATGLTAAEIVKARADAEIANMGLTNWKGSRVLKGDVGTAKNYLYKDEIDTLNRITVMFLDQAEFRARRRHSIHMADWDDFLDKFISDVELPVLDGAGTVSHDLAIEHAGGQYEQFADRRRLESQQQADRNYIEDLKNAADILKRNRGSKGGDDE